MEYVACNLCGADDSKFMFHARDRNCKEKRFFSIVKCRKCGLAYLNPRPDREKMMEYYPSWYHYRTKDKTIHIEETKSWGTPWREIMRKKAEPILRYKTSGRILDAGCGDGSLLKYMQELGWQTYGVEPHDVSARYAREVQGLNVFSGKLEEADYPEGSFDVITLFHALEHMADPLGALGKIYSFLDKNGYLVIEVPNFGSCEARIFRSKWVGIAAPLHLHHFTPRTLLMMLKKAGFIPVRLEFVPPAGRYIAGYSESLRYCLMDLGLYPPREKWVESIEGEKGAAPLSPSWNNPLHFMEYIIFYALARFMDKMGRGACLLVVARKESRSVTSG